MDFAFSRTEIPKIAPPAQNRAEFACAPPRTVYSPPLFCRPKADKTGAWLSLVERLVRDQEVAGSNPVAPTIFPNAELWPTFSMGR